VVRLKRKCRQDLTHDLRTFFTGRVPKDLEFVLLRWWMHNDITDLID
jgi:hypothetical protein